MELGFLPEVSQAVAGMTCWHPGPIEHATVLGLKTGSLKVDWKKVYGVAAFRCPRCGLLRCYAVRPEG